MDKIYVINLESATARYERFSKRWCSYKDNIEWIDAIQANSEWVSWALDNYKSDPNKHPVSRAEAACLLSHLRAIKQFIRDGGEYALIIEDDARPHIAFKEIYEQLKKHDHDILLLSPYLVNVQNIVFQSTECGCIVNNERQTFAKFKTTEMTYSTLAYRISKKYASQVLETYANRKFCEIQVGENRLTAEHITRYCPDSYAIWPPVCIDEALDTSIQHPVSCEYHKKYNANFDESKYLPI